MTQIEGALFSDLSFERSHRAAQAVIPRKSPSYLAFRSGVAFASRTRSHITSPPRLVSDETVSSSTERGKTPTATALARMSTPHAAFDSAKGTKLAVIGATIPSCEDLCKSNKV
jgi:hypothetical protein